MKKIKLLGQDFEIIYDNVGTLAGDCIGKNFIPACEIHIDKGLKQSVKEETLMHEIFETINDKLQTELPHAIINSYSEILYCILKDNKMLDMDKFIE